MKLVVISVGKPRDTLYKREIEEYHRRINTSITCDWQAVREISGKRPTTSVVQEEGAGILKKVSERDFFILLDGSGESKTSKEFSVWLFEKIQKSMGRVIMCVGGPYGVSLPVKERADSLLSISPMTLPHELCLLVLFEQLYRAITIEKGGNYHH